MKGIIVVDVEKCLACRSCQVQCAVEHSRARELVAAIRERPAPRARVRVEAVDGLAVPLQCRHCADAPCVRVCPSRALEKAGPDDPVSVVNERCIGCRLCVLACPFGLIDMDESGNAVVNCDLCVERLKRDRLPACVEGCPTKALRFMDLKDVSSEKRMKYLTSIARGER